MPWGKGSYGKKRGRPSKKKKGKYGKKTKRTRKKNLKYSKRSR